MSIGDPALRRAVRIVALLNIAYFGIEFGVARSIGSVSLFADSIDFLEDTALNLLVLFALGWILQGVGHAFYEKKSPAFLRNVLHMLIGPLWVFADVMEYI